MNHENTFAVIRYKNRNGVTSWRVSGWLRGVRIRKYFKTREEAGADKAANHGGKLVSFIALCLFAGIRPDLYEGEISKLDPKSVRLDTGVIHIEPKVSKVRMKRNITIQPNLAAWLQAYPLDDFPIMPVGFRRLRLKFRKHFKLSHDILRHTFISMHVGKFRSMGDAALQASNSEAIIRKHYLDLKSTAEAEQFFGILPVRATQPKMARPVAFPAKEVAPLPIAV